MTVHKNLEKILVEYATGEHGDFGNFLGRMSNSSLVSALMDILAMYFNDKNSSAVREQVTTTLAGYQHRKAKLGYNGFKRDVKGATINCEVKPQNVLTDDGKKKKLNGLGSFNDYTWKRFHKDLQENPNILVSGFVDGRLVYIIEFPFKNPDVVKKLESQLKAVLPDGVDKPKTRVRGAGITYLNFIQDENVKLVYCAPDFESFKAYIVRNFFTWLKQEAEKLKAK